jgi:uncharacterized OB-fold protein
MTTRIDRDQASAAFFDGTANGELLLHLCRSCGRLSPPRMSQCLYCGSVSLDWKPAAGTATLVSWAIPYDRSGTAIAVAGLVELTEGPWLLARIVDVTTDLLAAGLTLTVGFERSGDDESGTVEPTYGEEALPVDGEVVPVLRPTGASKCR